MSNETQQIIVFFTAVVIIAVFGIFAHLHSEMLKVVNACIR